MSTNPLRSRKSLFIAGAIAGSLLLAAVGWAATSSFAAGPGSRAWACAEGGMGGRGGEWGYGRGGSMSRWRWMAADLDLTTDQRDKIHGILLESLPAMRPLIDKQEENRKALADAVHAPKVDEAGIRQAASDLAGSTADLSIARAHVGEQIRAVLTADQIQKLDDRRARMQERRQQRRQLFRDHAGEFLGAL